MEALHNVGVQPKEVICHMDTLKTQNIYPNPPLPPSYLFIPFLYFCVGKTEMATERSDRFADRGVQATN